MKQEPRITWQAIKLAKEFRFAVTLRDKHPGFDQYDERVKRTEAAAKADPLAWALLTVISSDELSHVFASVRGQYRWEQTRGGMRCRHFIKSGNRYSSRSSYFHGMTAADAEKPGNNPVVYLRPLKKIEKKLFPADAPHR